MREPNAFEHYLISLDFDAAIMHFVQCLKQGGSDNQAWILMEEFNGPDWSVEPSTLRDLIGNTLTKLKIQYINDERKVLQ